MADAQVDFGAPVRIDAYAGTTQEQALLFDTGELPYGEHTVTLTVAGEKNEASSDTWIEFDKVELSDSQNGAPVINKVVWNDENPNLKSFPSGSTSRSRAVITTMTAPAIPGKRTSNSASREAMR